MAGQEEYPESPPADHDDVVDADIVAEAKGKVWASSAEILRSLDAVGMKELVEALQPIAKKVRWYESRYSRMKKEIERLREENEAYAKRISNARARYPNVTI